MTEIGHNVVIKATPEKIYKAITTQEGLANWWAKQTTAKPQIGFVNTFAFWEFRNEMKVTILNPTKKLNGNASILLKNGLIQIFRLI
jgi:uncharacterized protein YndB with AHSA1/START domain